MMTRKVRVEVVVVDTFVVHAEDDAQAERAARNCALSRLRYDRREPTDEGDTHVRTKTFVLTAEPAADERPDTYVCSGCGEPWPKPYFGPGWIACPSCGSAPEPVSP